MMNRGRTMTTVAAGIIGATIGAYAISRMSPKDRKKAMRRTRRILTKTTGILLSNIL
jgi:hypothetical protein